jgi:hypothetical protein
MSAKVYDLKKFRNKKHHSWIRKNESRINDVIRYYLSNNFSLDFEFISQAYQSQKREGFDESWDYLDLREIISDILDQSNLLDMILDDLKTKKWFDEKQISRQKLLEICLSIFVLETGIYA